MSTHPRTNPNLLTEIPQRLFHPSREHLTGQVKIRPVLPAASRLFDEGLSRDISISRRVDDNIRGSEALREAGHVGRAECPGLWDKNCHLTDVRSVICCPV